MRTPLFMGLSVLAFCGAFACAVAVVHSTALGTAALAGLGGLALLVAAALLQARALPSPDNTPMWREAREGARRL